MQVIDLRGVSCPTNFVKAKLALEDLENGTIAQILLDDGEPTLLFARLRRGRGGASPFVLLGRADAPLIDGGGGGGWTWRLADLPAAVSRSRGGLVDALLAAGSG